MCIFPSPKLIWLLQSSQCSKIRMAQHWGRRWEHLSENKGVESECKKVSRKFRRNGSCFSDLWWVLYAFRKRPLTIGEEGRYYFKCESKPMKQSISRTVSYSINQRVIQLPVVCNQSIKLHVVHQWVKQSISLSNKYSVSFLINRACCQLNSKPTNQTVS